MLGDKMRAFFWLKLILVSVFVSPPDQIKFNLFLLFLFFLDVMVSLDLGIRVEVFYLNTIEQLFLFVEQLDQSEVYLPYSRLLSGIPKFKVEFK